MVTRGEPLRTVVMESKPKRLTGLDHKGSGQAQRRLTPLAQLAHHRRRGSASSPRMDHVRVGQDITSFEREGVLWVAARSGGVSTFSSQGIGTHWWRLPRGYTYPDTPVVVNDHGNHYNWEPSADMPFAQYVTLLAAVHPHCIKVS